MNNTAPQDLKGDRYVGPAVGKDGKLICPKCGKPYSECDCDDPENTVHSGDIPDDLLKRRMGQGDQKEETMDFYDGIYDLLLEEFQTKKKEAPVAVEESMKNPTPEETKAASKFLESFNNYLVRNGDNIDRKPSDVGVKPTNGFKAFYSDHMLKPNKIR